MAIKERKQITGTEAQIKGYAGHNGVLAYATDTKHLHVLSGTAGTTTKLANMSDIPAPVDISGKADKTYVDTELAKKQAKGDYATNATLTQGLAGKANTSHTHTVSQITDMPKGVLSVNGTKPDSSGNVNVTLAAYPIGSIYMSTNSTDPGTLFGGTWQALNEGRVLIGASASHPAGETGGEETHMLTTREMPSHSHSGSTDSAGSHSHSGSATSSGDHIHSITYGNGAQASSKPQYGNYSTNRSTRDTSSAGSHSHSVSIDSNGSHSHTVTINSTGGGQAHNNMQPYLSVYMWERTA